MKNREMNFVHLRRGVLVPHGKHSFTKTRRHSVNGRIRSTTTHKNHILKNPKTN